MQNLLKDCLIVKVSSGAAAGQTAVTGTHVDLGVSAGPLGGYDGVCFIADLGAVTDGSVLSLKAQDGALSNDTDQADITGATTATLTAATSSNKLVVLDVLNPQKRYVRPVLGRTTQNAAVNTIIAILYRAKNRPAIADASVILSAVVNAQG